MTGEKSQAVYRSVCQTEGGELASIHSWEENVFLTSLLSDSPRATLTWLGAEGCVKDQTNCTWLDGSVWDFDNWGPSK